MASAPGFIAGPRRMTRHDALRSSRGARPPSDALIDRRVPKTLLIENGAFASGDRRHIREGIEELRWLAALKPATVGIAEYRDAGREYLEIAILKIELRPAANGGRLVELVHRAVPYPVLLIVRRQGTPEL